VAEDNFDRLRNALPDIAKAVNEFKSETVQEQVLAALLQSLGLSQGVPPSPAGGGMNDQDDGGDGGADEVEETTTTTTTRRRRKPPKSVSAEKDINFRPSDKDSLRDFAAAKAPTTNHERNLIAVYYMEQILELSDIGAGHVLAAYRDCQWREPGAPVNSLQVTASAKSWIDTKDMKAIRTTPGGRNTVEHDMPIAKSKAKKK
jgi:hypothetical protein